MKTNRLWALLTAIALGASAGAEDRAKDAISRYLETLRQTDGAYAYPGQDVSHLSATYAAVMTYAVLGRQVPGDVRKLAGLVAKGLYPIPSQSGEAARTRWHAANLREYRLQQVRALRALGDKSGAFRQEIDRRETVDGYMRAYEEGENPILIQQVCALLAKESCGLLPSERAKTNYTAYLRARERANGSFNTTPAADGSDGHVVNTAYALAGLRILGEKGNGRAIDWIRACQRKAGGFTWAPNPPVGGVEDVWYAWAAVRALVAAGARPADEPGLRRWLVSLWNADGGFAPRPGWKSDPMATFRAVDALNALGWLDGLRPDERRPATDRVEPDRSDWHAWTIQFQAPGSGSVKEAVQIARDLKIHLWGAKNAQDEWIAAAQREADRLKVPVTFFRSDEDYGQRRNLPGLGSFTHIRDPATPPVGAKDRSAFNLWQICDHECCARIWLDSGAYDAIGTFHFGCFDMSWLLPFLYQYDGAIPLVANQDSHGETWWWRDELKAYRTVFLAKEGTWDAFRDACAKGLVTSVREDAHTENRLRMIGGRLEAKARLRELEDEWRVRSLGNRVSVQLLTPADVFETARPKEGRLIRVRVDYKWRESRGILDPTCRLKSAELDGRELAVVRKVFRHEKKDYMHNVIEEAYDLIALPEGCSGTVGLVFEPLPGVGGEPFTVQVPVRE